MKNKPLDIDWSEMQQSALKASVLLKSIANPGRLVLLCALVGRAHTVTELKVVSGLSQSALSQHLARLRKQDIVATRRDKQKIYYSLADENVKAIIQSLYRIYCLPKEDLPADDSATLPKHSA